MLHNTPIACCRLLAYTLLVDGWLCMLTCDSACAARCLSYSEIILRPYQFCNLTEVIIKEGDDIASLKRKARLATILGTFQATLVSTLLLLTCALQHVMTLFRFFRASCHQLAAVLGGLCLIWL